MPEIQVCVHSVGYVPVSGIADWSVLNAQFFFKTIFLS